MNQAIAKKYLKQQLAGEPPIFLEDPEHYRALTNLISRQGLINQEEIGARQLLNTADEVYQQVGIGAKNKSRAYTPDEVAAQHLRDILLDLLEQRGIDVSGPKSDWAQWVPIRTLGLKLQTPSGPGQLIRIVTGKDPVRAKHLDRLEILLGEKLDTQTRKVWNQLNSLKQEAIVEQAKQVEFHRLMQQEDAFYRGQQLTEKRTLAEKGIAEKQTLAKQQDVTARAMGESESARKLRVEQQARHREAITKIIYEGLKIAALGAVGAAGYGILRGIKSMGDAQ